jgi:phosphoribosylformylglycinamidine synthase
MGFGEVQGARIGKVIELEVEPLSENRIEEMARKLLANPVIEDFTYEVVAAEAVAP